MTWPETLDLELTGIAQGGAAVGRWQGRVVFAYGGLPGEQVRVRLQQRQKSFASGAVVTVHTAAPERIAPRDPSAEHADWQYIVYPAQLALKRQIVAEQLAHLAGLGEVPVAATLPAPLPWGYRNSATFHGDAEGRLGYYAPGSRRVADRAHDPLLREPLNQAFAALRQIRAAASPRSTLRAVTLRTNRPGEVLAALEGTGDLEALARGWQAHCPALVGVLHRHRDGGRVLWGAQALQETIDGAALEVSAASFFQVNVDQAEAIAALARTWLEPLHAARVLDAYCGVGTFALPLAAAGASVVGIEEHPAAVDDARRNASRLGLDLVMLPGRVEDVLGRLDPPFDAALLDPPRRGCAPEALDALVRHAPSRIVYVSCHPGTLARDLQQLVGGGYRVARVQPVDMFPQTHHIETVVLLERG